MFKMSADISKFHPKCWKFMWPTRNRLPRFKFRNGVNVTKISVNFRNFERFWGSKYWPKLIFHFVLFSFGSEPINSLDHIL